MAMLHIVLTCGTEFAHRRFRYRAGVLHSANDEPAAVFAPNSRMYMKGAYLTEMCVNRSVTYKSCMSLIYRQSRWYCTGELHRDYGPAVELHRDYGHAVTGLVPPLVVQVRSRQTDGARLEHVHGRAGRA